MRVTAIQTLFLTRKCPMIVSHKFEFVFLHNPKVGGTSVRKTIRRFSDSEVRFYLNDPDPSSPLHRIDRAHIGLDEFTKYYPDLRARCAGYRFYSLWRPPAERIYSSLHEYSRNFANTDVRFLTPAKRRDFLMTTLDMLKGYGTAEGILNRFELTHFRPQWIYVTSEDNDIEVETIPLQQIDRLFAEIGARAGVPDLKPDRISNASESLAFPGILSGILANKKRKMMIKSISGVPFLTRLARKALVAHQPRQSPRAMYGLSESDLVAVDEFLGHFYQKDFERIPAMSSRHSPSGLPSDRKNAP